MLKFVTMTFVVLHISVEVLSGEGCESSQMGGTQAKLCENDELINTHDNGLGEKKLSENDFNNEKENVKSPSIISGEVKSSLIILDESSKQNRNQEQMKRKGTPNFQPTLENGVPGFRSTLSFVHDFYRERIIHFQFVSRRRRDLATFLHRQTTVSDISMSSRNDMLDETQIHEKFTSVGTSYTNNSNYTGINQLRNIETENSKESSKRKYALKDLEVSTEKTNDVNVDDDAVNHLVELHNRWDKSKARFVTDSSELYPFISRKQALNYLVSLDSVPRPRRWPIKLILPDVDSEKFNNKKELMTEDEKQKEHDIIGLINKDKEEVLNDKNVLLYKEERGIVGNEKGLIYEQQVVENEKRLVRELQLVENEKGLVHKQQVVENEKGSVNQQQIVENEKALVSEQQEQVVDNGKELINRIEYDRVSYKEGSNSGKSRHPRFADQALQQLHADDINIKVRHDGYYGNFRKLVSTTSSAPFSVFKNPKNFVTGISDMQTYTSGTDQRNSIYGQFAGSNEPDDTNTGTSNLDDKLPRKRLCQQQRRRNKKLRKQKNKRKKKEKRKDEDTNTTSSTDATYPIISFSNIHLSVEVTTMVSNLRKRKKDKIYSATMKPFLNRKSIIVSEHENPAMTSNSQREGSSTTASVHEHMSKNYTFSKYKENSERIVDKSRGVDAQILENTSKASYERHEDHAKKTKSKTKKTSSVDTDNKFQVTAQNKNNNDSNVFVSLSSETSTTNFSLPIIGEKQFNVKEAKAVLEKCSEENTNGTRDNTDQNLLDRRSEKHMQNHTNFDPESRRHTISAASRWYVSQGVQDNRLKTAPKIEKSTGKFADSHNDKVVSPLSMQYTTQGNDDSQNENTTTSLKTSRNSEEITTFENFPPTESALSELSSAREWLKSFKQKKGGSQSEAPEDTKNKDNGKVSMEDNNRRGSLAAAFSKTTPVSTTTMISEKSISQNVQENKKDQPFIDHKTAFDFLSNYNGPKIGVQNEKRREANEFNRFLAERMCKIFNKRYVPTNIGGKCE